jgi:hypothetical protein
MLGLADGRPGGRLGTMIAVLGKRDRDGTGVKVLERQHTEWSDDTDRLAVQAAESSQAEYHQRRRCRWGQRAADLALESTVSDQRQTTTDRRSCGATARAMRRTGEVKRGRVRNPGLEIEGKMNKNGATSGSFTIRWGW